MAAVLFFEASHTYPGNYHICCWRAPAELLEVTGRKRLGVAAICSKAVASRTVHKENKIRAMSAQRSFTCHLMNCQLDTCFVSQPSTAGFSLQIHVRHQALSW